MQANIAMSLEDLLEQIMPINPFDDSFVKNEIKFMGLDNLNTIKQDGITIKPNKLMMRCDDYLNKNWRTGELICPVFFIDKELWMSLTPMEIQSNFIPWFIATDDVGIGGLGIGYAALKCAEKEEVYSVTVFESDERVINLFKHLYQDRPYFDKFKFIIGDVRRTMKDYTFDYVYMDIYQDMLPIEVVNDLQLFPANNDIGEYRFWGQELVYLAGMLNKTFSPSQLSYPELAFFRKWQNTEESEMTRHMPNDEFIEEIIYWITEN